MSISSDNSSIIWLSWAIFVHKIRFEHNKFLSRLVFFLDNNPIQQMHTGNILHILNVNSKSKRFWFVWKANHIQDWFKYILD